MLCSPAALPKENESAPRWCISQGGIFSDECSMLQNLGIPVEEYTTPELCMDTLREKDNLILVTKWPEAKEWMTEVSHEHQRSWAISASGFWRCVVVADEKDHHRCQKWIKHALWPGAPHVDIVTNAEHAVYLLKQSDCLRNAVAG
eukprot:GEMP01023498.1.p1 GENE.GEMP01023498.1~~GEMP01023498.1.p1  ORF type:complete len:166 (+),score=31.71 GEMP01023498.1:62-499(+)